MQTQGDLCILSQSLWVRMNFDHVDIENLVSLSSTPSVSYTLTIFSSARFPEPRGEGLDGDIPLSDTRFQVLLCLMSGCELLCLFLSAARGRFS